MQLSIIIPMYNAQQFIVKLLDSIYDQDSFQLDFEVIIVDDASLDNSVALVSDYFTSRNITNLRLIEANKNSGTAASRNRAIAVSRGLWTQFVDSDDCLPANYFQAISDKLNCDVDCYIYGLQNRYSDSITTISPTGDIDQRMIGFRNCVTNKIYRTEIISEFEPQYQFEDVIWLTKLIGSGIWKCETIDQLYYQVNRDNPQSKMANVRQIEWKKMALETVKAAVDGNHFAREFVLETFVGTLFTDIYSLKNRIIVAGYGLKLHYRFLPQVYKDGIRKKIIIQKTSL